MNVVSTAQIENLNEDSPLAPQTIEQMARIRGDLRLGVPVILTAGRQAAMVVAVEMLTAARLDVLQGGPYRPEIVVTRHRAVQIGLAHPANAKVVRFALPVVSDLDAIRRYADPIASDAPDLPGGDTAVQGVAGAVLHEAAIALAKSAQLLPAVIVVPVKDAAVEAMRLGLGLMSASAVLAELAAARVQLPVSAASLPMAVHPAGHVHVFRPDDGGTEHYAIRIGTPDLTRPVLVRLHSACFTGDVLGSLKCDCGPQLQAATAAMAAQGAGVLLYLNQEGRGIGLANKMRAYALQDRGLDTVEANNHLGFDDDERDFRIGAALLREMGIGAVRLLTNNPAKVSILQACGITVVERVPLEVGKTAQNAGYLATKAAKSGHLLK